MHLFVTLSQKMRERTVDWMVSDQCAVTPAQDGQLLAPSTAFTSGTRGAQHVFQVRHRWVIVRQLLSVGDTTFSDTCSSPHCFRLPSRTSDGRARSRGRSRAREAGGAKGRNLAVPSFEPPSSRSSLAPSVGSGTCPRWCGAPSSRACPQARRPGCQPPRPL